MTKTITISMAGTDGKDARDVELPPGTKSRDVLSQLNLVGFQLEKPGGGFFERNDDIYEAVTDGQKLFASKGDVVAGG